MLTLSLICLLGGVALCGLAPSDPDRRVALEWACGVLLIAGLGLLGFGLRLFR